MTKLEREWAAKLRASGFQDLEGPDRDGPLSNAGKLHAVAETAEEHERLASRIADGTAYQDWARSVLHGRRWADKTDRQIWEMHCDGEGLREITKRLGVSWKRATRVIDGAKAGSKGNKGNKGGTKELCQRSHVRALVRRCDPRLVQRLALLLLRHATPKQSSTRP